MGQDQRTQMTVIKFVKRFTEILEEMRSSRDD